MGILSSKERLYKWRTNCSKRNNRYCYISSKSNSIDTDFPQNGYLWFVKDLSARKSEIGELVPKVSFQILGYTGVTLLVIPQYNLVAVRAFNSFGSPTGFDYLADVKEFGNTIMKCLLK